jgi:ribosome-associated protein
MPQSFQLSTEYIDLLQFLKATGIAATGGEAKAMVDDGLVDVNGEPESRRRRKLRDGDELTIALTPEEQWVIQGA